MSFKYIVLTVYLLIVSCGGDDGLNEQTPGIIMAIAPIITDINDVVIEDDLLIISGSNFSQETFDTKVIIDDVEFPVTPINNTRIELVLGQEPGIGRKNLKVKVGSISSNELPVFIILRGWNTIELADNLNLKKTFVFDNSLDLYSRTDIISGTSTFNQILKFTPSAFGYSYTNTNVEGGSVSQFQINDDGKSIATNNYGVFISDNFFESQNVYSLFSVNDPVGFPITIIDQNIRFATLGLKVFGASENEGQTFEKNYTNFLFAQPGDNYGAEFFGSVNSIGKASNGSIYGTGVYLKSRKGNGPDTNLIFKSENYKEWTVVDTVTIGNQLNGAKFIDTNLILTVLPNSSLEISRDLAQTWTSIRSGVKSFFIRSREEWFIVTTNNEVLSTVDSGASWVMELVSSQNVNYVGFSDSKVIVAGEGVLFLKYE